jgi:hypothetical protein
MGLQDQGARLWQNELCGSKCGISSEPYKKCNETADTIK